MKSFQVVGRLPFGKNTLATAPEDPLSTGCRYDEPSTMRDRFHCARLLAFVTGLVNQELLLRNEYLIAENRILRSHLPNRLRLSDPERATLAEIAKRLGRKALNDIARVAKPDTILALVPTPDCSKVRRLAAACRYRPPSGFFGN